MIKRLILFICATLAACTVLPERAQVNLYQLPPASLASSSQNSSEQFSGLRLARPASSDALGGRLLLIMADDNAYQAYPDVRWTASIPVLWRDWLLDALWRDGRITGLSTDSERLQASVELGGILRGLHIETRQEQAEAVVSFDARLVDITSRQIIASQRFECREPLSSTDASKAVYALGRAADRLAGELIDWLLEHLNEQNS